MVSFGFSGQDDIFYTREGGEADMKDLPNAETHRLDSGHFAVEDRLDQIANMRRLPGGESLSRSVGEGLVRVPTTVAELGH
jgi:hypothetical protein